MEEGKGWVDHALWCWEEEGTHQSFHLQSMQEENVHRTAQNLILGACKDSSPMEGLAE